MNNAKTKACYTILILIALITICNFVSGWFYWGIDIFYSIKNDKISCISRIENVIVLLVNIILVTLFFTAISFAFKKKVKCFGVFAIAFIASIFLFIIEINFMEPQYRNPVTHIGNQYYDMTVGYRKYYYNWLWYNETELIWKENIN